MNWIFIFKSQSSSWRLASFTTRFYLFTFSFIDVARRIWLISHFFARKKKKISIPNRTRWRDTNSIFMLIVVVVTVQCMRWRLCCRRSSPPLSTPHYHYWLLPRHMCVCARLCAEDYTHWANRLRFRPDFVTALRSFLLHLFIQYSTDVSSASFSAFTQDMYAGGRRLPPSAASHYFNFFFHFYFYYSSFESEWVNEWIHRIVLNYIWTLRWLLVFAMNVRMCVLADWWVRRQ